MRVRRSLASPARSGPQVQCLSHLLRGSDLQFLVTLSPYKIATEGSALGTGADIIAVETCTSMEAL